MTIQELELYLELLSLSYGNDYINDFHTISELLLLEFDIKISPEELASLTQMELNTEDVMLNLKMCGINY